MPALYPIWCLVGSGGCEQCRDPTREAVDSPTAEATTIERMNRWMPLLLLGCDPTKAQPCMDGTVRNDRGHCVPDNGAAAGDDRPDSPLPSDTGETDRLDTGGAPAEPPPPPDYPPTPPLMNLSASTLIFEGGTAGARVGRSGSGAGDIDGDGRVDLLIGADRANGVTGAEYAGWVTLHLSANLPADGVVAVEGAHARWLGQTDGELLGHNVAAAGDINGDGQADLLIAGYHSPAGGHNRGTVYGISGTSVSAGTRSIGSADWSVQGSRDIEGLGHGMSTAGDVDGDGLMDLVMGGCCSFPPELGRAWVITGAEFTAGDVDLTTHTPRWDGEAVDDQAGYKTSPAGDVDGDGLDDVAIGARLQSDGANRAGKVYVIFGSSIPGVDIGSLADADVHLPGTAIGGEQGYDIGPVGDLDGDGLDELITGAYHAGREAMVSGEAMLYLGGSLSTQSRILDTDADIRFVSSQDNHLLGLSVEGDMDLDGNGSIDVVLGAAGMAPPTQGDGGDSGSTVGMDSPGDVYLFWGEDLTPGVHNVDDASVHFEGEIRNDHAGIRVTSPGDVDGDGTDDLFIGTERGQNDIGRAYLLTQLSAE